MILAGIIAGATGYSNQASATPQAAASLLPPTNLTAVSKAPEQISITWDTPAGATPSMSYQIWRSTASGGPYTYIDSAGYATTSYTNLGMGLA